LTGHVFRASQPQAVPEKKPYACDAGTSRTILFEWRCQARTRSRT